MASHRVTLEFAETLPARLDAGATLVLKVATACAAGCDLAGHPLKLTDAAGAILAEGEVGADIAVTMPADVGRHDWSLVYPAHDAKGVLHPQSVLPIAAETKPHDTSLAVWGVPSPLRMGEEFAVTVGATCTSGCNLTGKALEIFDAEGLPVTSRILGASPWPQTKALYWVETKLIAPQKTGRASWSVRFAAQELRLPHGGASFNFGAEIVPPPEHRVTVRVVEKGSALPLDNAQVRLGVFFATSGKDGIAEVETPRGTYELDVLKTGYDIQPTSLAVSGDTDIQVEMTMVPKEDPDAHWYHNPDKG